MRPLARLACALLLGLAACEAEPLAEGEDAPAADVLADDAAADGAVFADVVEAPDGPRLVTDGGPGQDTGLGADTGAITDAGMDAGAPADAAPDSGALDASSPDAEPALDARAVDAGLIDAGPADVGSLDAAGLADAAARDAAAPDASPPDASAAADAAAPDASSAADAAPRDAAAPDAAPRDAAAPDAAPDAAPRDAAAADAAAPDAAPRDAAAPDAAAPDAAPRDASAPDAALDAGVLDASSPADAGGDPTNPAATPTVCTPPVGRFDVSNPTTVVGNGTAASCTEAALTTALAAGGVITFACGPLPVTIPITSEKVLRTNTDTILDGGGRVTLDGAQTTRILRFENNNYRVGTRRVVLQRLTLINGRATGTPLPPATPPLSQGFGLDGGGGAVFVRDGLLFVIDSLFRGNQAAPLGPDVGGGAIYALGTTNVTIVGSRFVSNSASNGGALGALQATLTVVNSVFETNHAVGHGANAVDAQGRQIGSGGLGGAVYVDGQDTGLVTVCGSRFAGNDALSLGGAFFRVAEVRSPMVIDRSTFDGNRNLVPPPGESTGAGAAYIQGCTTTLTNTTFARNSSPEAGGALRLHDSALTMTNCTLAENSADGLGGAMFVGTDVTGRIQSTTFGNNRITGGPGRFSAAISAFPGTPLTVADTLFAGNSSTDSFNPVACGFAPLTDGGGNLQWPRNRPNGSPDTACTTNITWADPQLGALAANGGPTETMLPGTTSPARTSGLSCPATDQRGLPRPAMGCASGAAQP